MRESFRGISLKSLKPYFFEFLGSTAPQLVGIGVSSVIVKGSGIATYGQYSMLIALVTLTWGIFCTAVDQDFQRTCEPAKVFDALSDKFIAWIIIMPAVIIFAGFTRQGGFTIALFGIGMFFLHAVQSRVVRDRIRGRDIWSVLPRLTPVLVFLALLFVIRPKGIVGVALLFGISWATGLAYSFRLCLGIRFKLSRFFSTARRVWPIWTSILITQAYGNLDLYVIRMFHSVEVVGVYKIAYTFAGMAIPAFGAFCYVYLTKISSAVLSRDAARIKKAYHRQLALCGIMGIGLMAFMFLIFPWLSGMLYGEAGREAVVPAQWLSLAMVLNCFTMVYSFSLISLHMEKTIVVLTAGGAVFYLATSFFLIRGHGATGAGIAMALAYSLLLAVYHRVYVRALRALAHPPKPGQA